MRCQRMVIIGAGGMAREMESALHSINRREPRYEFLGFVVSELSRLGPRDSRHQVCGDLAWLQKNASNIDAIALGVGSPAARLRIATEVKALLPNIEWPAIVHPSALIDFYSACLEEGTYIGARVTATVNIRLERFALCNFACTLGHETRVGPGSVINPGANIAGGVTIGEGVLVGSGAQVLQYLNIAAKAVVGAGAVVTRDVGAGETVIGIPARPMQKTLAASQI